MDKTKLSELSTPSGDKRILAGLAHIAVVLGSGIILPVVLTIVFRNKSFAVAAQSFQAAVYNLLVIVFLVILSVLLVIPFLGPLNLTDYADTVAVMDYVNAMVIYTLIITVIACIFMVPAVVGGIRNLMGKSFYYPLIGLPAVAWFYLRFGLRTETE